MKLRFIFLPFVIGLTFLLLSCGPSMEDVALEFKPQFDALRTDLQTIAASLPEKVKNQPVTQPLDPPPDYSDGYEAEIRNTDIMMYAQLLNPDVDMDDREQLDLILSRAFVNHLKWTGAGELYKPNDRASSEWRDGFEKTLQIRYLGVARVNLYEPPIAVSADEFVGGYAEIDGFLVDMQSQAILCSFSISAFPNDEVSYSYEAGEEMSALERFARSTLWENAREAFVESMTKMCGGSFTLD